jgi:hypothetical protein
MAKDKILIEVKSLLDNFSDKLNKIKTTESHFKSSESNSGLREEGSPWKTEQEFKDLTMLNAPFVEKNFIVGEKMKWN